MSSTITNRAYASQNDFWRVRQLLIDAYPITGPGYLWEIRRWDGQHYHSDDLRWNPLWEQRYRLWETTDGQLIGLVHPEGDPGNAHFEIHPDFRSRIEDEMISWAEEHLPAPNQDGVRQLETFAFEHDSLRVRLLEAHGFIKTPYFGMMRHMFMGSQPLPAVEMAEGYALRSTCSEPADYNRMAALLNAAFNRSVHTAVEYENFARFSPSFRHDLNFVAVASDGTFAAHVGVTYEPNNRYGIIEPVCTHPDHRRHGLAQTLIFHSLHRLRALGAQHVHVDTGSMEAANALYDSIGFSEAYRGYYWQKVY
ncbi:MAG: GNAT family N-acetyltransferase [Anaerolinea sp.]|nr:GNAT family N-acetyltransferase [Anaerolinea sp.]